MPDKPKRAGSRILHKKKGEKRVKRDLPRLGALRKGSSKLERSFAKELTKLGEDWREGEKFLDPRMQSLIKAERQRERRTFTLKDRNKK